MASPTTASTWSVPRPILAASMGLVAMLAIPVVGAALIGGRTAALAVVMAITMCTAPATRLRPRAAALLVVLVAATAVVATSLSGQPFAAACFAVLVCLLVAPANMVDNGLLAAVPAIGAVYLGAPALQLSPTAAAGWTLFGGAVTVALLSRAPRPAALEGVSPPVAYRHAVVMAAALGVSVYLVLELEVPHGYWIPMTLALVLVPYTAATHTRALQRIWGTIGGALIALVLALTLPTWAIALALIPLTALNVSYSLLGRYGQAVVFLTPGVVLVANFASRQGEISASLERVLATLVGALCAAGLALLLDRSDQTPAPEPDDPASVE